MRTKQQEIARYRWLTPAAFGERIGVSAEHVRSLIQAGEIRALDVSLPGSKRVEYRISDSEYERFVEARATAA
jgi:hypothetical protein